MQLRANKAGNATSAPVRGRSPVTVTGTGVVVVGSVPPCSANVVVDSGWVVVVLRMVVDPCSLNVVVVSSGTVVVVVSSGTVVVVVVPEPPAQNAT